MISVAPVASLRRGGLESSAKGDAEGEKPHGESKLQRNTTLFRPHHLPLKRGSSLGSSWSPGPQGHPGKGKSQTQRLFVQSIKKKKKVDVAKISQESSGNNSSPMPLKLSYSLPNFFQFGVCVYTILQTYPCSRCVQ